MIPENILSALNAPEREERLQNLAAALRGATFPPRDPRYINNHIHTTYSFSPYSPTAAVYAALAEGLCTAGIVDHDSIGGAREFLRAGEMAGLPVTIGVEARVNLQGTPLETRHTNSPDQAGLAYMVLHAVPHGSIDRVQKYFAPYRDRRNARNRRMLARINALAGVELDFAKDVLPLSMAHDGGSVTERHLMLALARAQHPGMGFLQEFARVGELKKDFLPKVYEDAGDEMPLFHEYAAFCASTGGVLAYPYLGDVGVSVTGDKKAQKFEDEYLDELFDFISAAGIKAVTYMPTRNTWEQLERLRALCARHGMMEISGEDINSPSQSFVIKKMEDERFAHLIDSTWALIRHENGGNGQ